MMADNREEMLTALREQRRRQGRVQGILTLECPTTSCPVQSITLRIREQAGGHLIQPRLKCCRCGQEAWFVALE
jgi:hypothetical protein